MIKPKVGDMLVVDFIGCKGENNTFEINTLPVTRVGTKYFTVGAGLRFPMKCEDGSFNIYGKGTERGTGNVRVWSSDEVFKEYSKRVALVREIYIMASHHQDTMLRQHSCSLERALSEIGGKL
jgi:hypothetical protein